MTRPRAWTGGENEVEDLEIELLLAAVARRHGYDFRGYARASMRRRIRRAVEEEDLLSISGLQERVLHDDGALRRFLWILSVHVTSMFRDAIFYRVLRERVVPKLRTYPSVRVWVAGCATGEEVYSLAILLDEAGLYERSRLYATDLSLDLLAQAERGAFPLERMRAYTRNYQLSGGQGEFSSYYRTDRDRAVLAPELRRNICFSQHNLATDGAFNEFQLILCRNVMIYFDQPLRRQVHHLLYESLCSFGFLGLGLRETIGFTPDEARYQALDADARLYRRIP